jgi:hypothetical protein
MRNKKFYKINKALAILLILCFALSVTAVSASAHDSINYDRNSGGYKAGHEKGYEDGKMQAKKDCEKYGSRDNIKKIPSPRSKHTWTNNYKRSYINGYTSGYIDGYNQIRYDCLK